MSNQKLRDQNTTSLPSLLRRLKTGVSWSLVSSIFNSLCNFLMTIFVARILGKEIFGEFGMVQSTVVTLSGVAQLATGYTATKYVAEYRATDKEKVGRIIGLCSTISTVTAIFSATILFLYAPWLATNSLKTPILAPSLMIATGMVFFLVLNGYQMGALAGLESYEPMAKGIILSSLLSLLVCSIGSWLYTLNGAIAALGISAVFQWMIFRYILNLESKEQSISIQLKGVLEEKKIFFRFALPAAISGFSSMPALWLAYMFLVRQKGGFSDMAIYSASNSLCSFVLFLPLILNKVSMSLLNNQKGLDDYSSFRKVFFINIFATIALVFIGAIIVAFSGPWLLSIFGKDFKGGYSVLLIMLLGTVFYTISQATYQIIQSQEKMWLSFWAIALPRDGSIILLSYFLVPLYGAVGLAWSYTASTFLALSVTVVLTLSIGLTPPKMVLVKDL